MVLKVAETHDDKAGLDELLWRVLWKPLDLPRNIRKEFSLPGGQIEIVALDNGTVIGGLVAVWTGRNELEIRHLAVAEPHQRKSVGTMLLSKLFDFVKRDYPVRVRTHARNTSHLFFLKHGFEPASEHWIEHPDFVRHGISFRLFQKYV